MTNKPMLSVERELLERVVDNRYREKENISIARHQALWELRALLDEPVKPVDPNELSLGGRLARAATGLINVLDDETGAWTETEALKQALEDWSMGKPAAQHQGGAMSFEQSRDGIADFLADNMPIKKYTLAEIERMIREVAPTPTSRTTGSIKQPTPVAVVLPERREPDPCSPYLSDSDIEWNAAIDAVTRLNTPQ